LKTSVSSASQRGLAHSLPGSALRRPRFPQRARRDR
jgi:hypothetical protein